MRNDSLGMAALYGGHSGGLSRGAVCWEPVCRGVSGPQGHSTPRGGGLPDPSRRSRVTDNLDDAPATEVWSDRYLDDTMDTEECLCQERPLPKAGQMKTCCQSPGQGAGPVMQLRPVRFRVVLPRHSATCPSWSQAGFAAGHCGQRGWKGCVNAH